MCSKGCESSVRWEPDLACSTCWGVICPPTRSHPSDFCFQFLQCCLHTSLTLLFLRGVLIMLLLLVRGALFLDHSCFRCSHGLVLIFFQSWSGISTQRAFPDQCLQPSPCRSSFSRSPPRFCLALLTGYHHVHIWVSVDCMSPVTKM